MQKNLWEILKEINKPILALAPLEDVTDVVFREIVTQAAKPDVMFTEFTHTDGLMHPENHRATRNLMYTEQQRPIVAQIWGNNPETFYSAAVMIKERGFDGLDINMGCPVRDVLKSGCGSALINNPNLAKELITAAKEGAGNVPVSVKTRIGVSKVVTEEWILWLLEQNLAALTVHGRTAKQMSKVPADWEEISKAVQLGRKIAPQTIILGNGDVTSYEQAVEKHNTYGVDGVMIGRGIFYNPWVFKKTLEAPNHSINEKLDLLEKHTNLYIKTWGDTRNFEALKKFFKIYISGFDGAAELRSKLMNCKNLQEVEEVVLAFKQSI